MKKLIIPILVLLFLGCEKEEVKTDTESVEAIQEYALVNKIFQDTGNNSGDAVLGAENDSSTEKVSATKNEATITISPADFTTFPKTIKVDFGTGVLGQDGVTRKGVINIVSTNWYRVEGSKHTSTFTNFYHNNHKVEGTHVVTNLGENEDDNLEYSVDISSGKIIKPNGGVINYTQNTTRTWIAGADTPLNIWDDEYLLDGSQSGTSSKGIDYELTVDESLHFVLYPREIKSGILNMDVGDITGVKVNYTNYTITILGNTYQLDK